MKLTNQEIQYINALDSIVNVSARNCFIDDTHIIFILNERDIGAAIGRKGVNIKKLQQKLGKNVEIIPYAADTVSFLKKVLFKIKIDSIEEKEENGKKVINLKLDAENKSKILKSSGRFKRLKRIVKKNYGVQNINLR